MPLPIQSLAEGIQVPPPGSWRVLVVDDDPVVRTLAVRILSEGGFDVCEAPDGAAALQLLERSAEPVHLVLSDIVMPRLNGVQLLEQLSVSYPDLPVILMSGYQPADLDAQGIAAPCAILRKPFAAEVLLAEVRRCLPALR
jgi:CheY-like chemotaxis protein